MPLKSSNMAMIEPAVETLVARSNESLWPSDILNHPDMIRESDLRQKLLAALEAFYRLVPKPTTPAIDAVCAVDMPPGISESLIELYNSLTAFLDADHLHRRLVLYIPFELIPADNWSFMISELELAKDRFVRSYKRCWRELLEETDVRANFVDGNILEKELAPDGQPRVIKAAHLIPQLLKKDIVSMEEVLALKDATSNDILRNSIEDAFFVAEKKEEVFESFGVARLRNLPDDIAREIRNLDMREAHDYAQGLPPARVAWERKDKEDVLISRYAKLIARLLGTTYPPRYILEYTQPTYSLQVRLCALRGLGLAGENRAEKNPLSGIYLCQEFLKIFKANWLDSPEISDELEGILARWVSIKIANELDVKKFGFELPKLDAGFSKTGPHAAEIREYEGAVKAIAQNPEYSRLLYPVGIFFGSRLKGYAKRNADLDAAVFVRPGVLKREREKIRGIVAKLFSDKKIGGKVVEFWLEKEARGLHIRDFPNPDVSLADSTWVHLLLQSVWLGENESIRELYAKLLPGFLNINGKKINGNDLRRLCLDEMEREVLQYRLMHKGYRRFFPPIGGIDQRAKGIDPTSVFWDSGYRRLATKLFVSRVFLPKVK